MRFLVTVILSLLGITFISNAEPSALYDDDYRAKQVEEINETSGFQIVLGARRPIKLENGVHYHGWLYNKELDAAIIQYTYAGKLFDSYKNDLAKNILDKWKGSTGSQFRKLGFKDIAILITEGTTSKVYSPKQESWYKVDDYLALNTSAKGL